MKLITLSLALVALVAAAAQADTVYFKRSNSHGIDSVTGTIVKEDSGVVEVKTEAGRTVSIPKGDVFQIVRGEGSGDRPPAPESLQTIPNGTSRRMANLHLEDYDEPTGPSRHHYGIKGGMNLSNMSVDPASFEEDGSLKSVTFGAWWWTPLTSRLDVQAEALYSVKGDTEWSGGYQSITKLSYLEMPVLAKMGFLSGAAAQPSLFVGPAISFNLASHSKLEGEGSEFDVDVKNQTSGMELGVVLGGGVDFQIQEHTCGLELRYARGLSAATGDDANGDAHNNTIAILGSFGLQ